MSTTVSNNILADITCAVVTVRLFFVVQIINVIVRKQCNVVPGESKYKRCAQRQVGMGKYRGAMAKGPAGSSDTEVDTSFCFRCPEEHGG